MTYEELKVSVDTAWIEFYKVLASDGVDIDKLDDALDRKDVFNSVMDCVIANAPLKSDEE